MTKPGEASSPIISSDGGSMVVDKALLADLWAKADEQIAVENQARRDAEAAGTISEFDAAVEQRGHAFTHFKSVRRSTVDRYLERSGQDSITTVSLDDGKEDVGIATMAGIYHECNWCGQEPDFTYDGQVLRSNTACEFPEGYTTEFTLTVTSGKIVVTDDLRAQYDVDETAFASYNTAKGQSQVMQAMASLGCAYGPVGNSCPGLYQTGPDTYAIANPAIDEETDEPVPFGTELAGICTDLWAYSIADFDDWVAKGGDPEAQYAPDIVEVPNGVYHFVHHTTEASFNDDYEGTTIYATITRTDA